jgi:glycerol-3-phosphate O-acyltransferase / dihydroxyacetone phosphate acyltransferase
VLGKENVPLHGPIIFTGNHMNQFVDGAVMLVTNHHRLSFLVAEKSFNQRIVGDFARLVSSIPVARPQDTAVKGVGQIRFEGLRLTGQGTAFLSLKKGDKIRPGRSPDAYKIKLVVSDTVAELALEVGEPSPLDEVGCQGVWVSYDVLGAIDQGDMFSKVHAALAQGSCLAIFPEGGSHDHTDLLPLKVGVAAIAFGALEKYDVNVPIVPVGLNYFRGHRFRGRVVVEFGQPIYLDKKLIQLHRESKRQAYHELLSSVRDGMRSVIVAASDYAELKMIHTARRLYQRPASGITTGDKQDLARRFNAAHRILLEREKEKCGVSRLPADLCDLQIRLEKYQDILTQWGLKDYQISHLEQLSFSKMLYSFMHGSFVMILATIPALILNAPVGFAASYWAFTEAKKDLKASRVKLAARDVMLSKKIMFCLVGVPILWVMYALLLLGFSSFSKRTVLFLFLSCPLFSYLGVMAVEAGMVDIKDLRPAFLRLLPSFRKETARLPAIRSSLQKEVRAMAKKYGPELGALYYGKASEWEISIGGRVDRSLSHDEDQGVSMEGVRVRTAVSTGVLGALGGSGFSSDFLMQKASASESDALLSTGSSTDDLTLDVDLGEVATIPAPQTFVKKEL